jgi:hypothetical protein
MVQEFNDLQTPKLSKKQLCDRTSRRARRNVDGKRRGYKHACPGQALRWMLPAALVPCCGAILTILLPASPQSDVVHAARKLGTPRRDLSR